MSEKHTIAPPSSWGRVDLAELYRYRQLLFSLAWRDIKVKYAQTMIGLLWAILNPLITITLLSFVFQRVAKVSTNGIPPFLFTLVGYGAWSYFSALLVNAGNSVITAQSMIQKIYFPRLVLPLSKAIAGLVEFAVILFCILVSIVFYQIYSLENLLFFPLILLLTIICGLAGGVWISALTVRYRDFRFVTPFLVQVGLFLTPIAYPLSSVPKEYQFLYMLNPMVGISEGFRWSLLGQGEPWPALLYSAIISSVCFLLGLMFFAKVEKTMADII